MTIAGRYLVLVPFSDKVSVSQKIKENEEKKRLKEVMSRIKPKNFGVIIRTVAEKKSTEDLEQDLKQLLEKWQETIRIYLLFPAFSLLKPFPNSSRTLLRPFSNPSRTLLFPSSSFA